MSYLDIDATLHPDLAERQTRISEEQSITNRLYALAEIVKARPGIPMVDGEPDQVSYNAWRGVFLGVSDAIQEIAEASVNWASEDRKGGE